MLPITTPVPGSADSAGSLQDRERLGQVSERLAGAMKENPQRGAVCKRDGKLLSVDRRQAENYNRRPV